YVVGSSYIAANISTEHFIGLIGAALIYGVCTATGEWSTIIAFTFMIFFFVPYLFQTKVLTAPEFLERRFNPAMRTLFAGVTLTVNIVAFLGPVLYGGALVVQEVFDANTNLGLDPDAIASGAAVPWGTLASIVVIAVASGVWAIWGGLRSIALMDLLTITVMVFGGLSVTYLGLMRLGDGDGVLAGAERTIDVNRADDGWAADYVTGTTPYILEGATTDTEYDRLSVLQPLNHKANPWTHWVFSFFYIGLWYTVINQHMIQKVLAAKDLYHARMGMVFASGLKLLLPFLVVVPGLIFFAMRPDFLQVAGDGSVSAAEFSRMSDDANKTYILMISELVPPVLVGILLAALFGAIQSTVCSVLNSTSTVFTVDIYKRLIRPSATEAEEVLVGRLSGAAILTVSIAVACVLATATQVNLFIWIQMLYVFFAPPFSATFLVGSVWRRLSGVDAFIASLVSFAFAGGLKILEFRREICEWAGSPEILRSYAELDVPDILIPFANQGMLVWIVCIATCVTLGLLTPSPDEERTSEGLVIDFSRVDFGGGMGGSLATSVTVLWGVTFASMIGLVAIFSVLL
ncbi:MAG: hypothetical protein AAGJ97_03615, partial [Planctomycetota bacterium]